MFRASGNSSVFDFKKLGVLDFSRSVQGIFELQTFIVKRSMFQGVRRLVFQMFRALDVCVFGHFVFHTISRHLVFRLQAFTGLKL